MQEGLVSIVVPIYKTEKYLEQCIKSIVNQTYQNLEIILVDDGSPDSCPQICDAWAEKDHRIRVIHKKNGGLSTARNMGIEEARGEYICFFDSDDFIAPHAIEHSYSAAKMECADVAVFGFSSVDNDGKKLKEYIPKPEKLIYEGEEIQTVFLPELLGADSKTGRNSDLWMSACMCLLSAKLIEQTAVRFSSEREIISEDVFFLLGLYRYVNKTVVLKEALYFYRENQQSITRSYRADRFQKVKIFYERCIELCYECGYTKEIIRRCAEPFISFTIAALKQEVMYHKTMKASLSRVQMIVDDNVLQQVLQEKKKDKTGFIRRILFRAMRNKMYRLCYILVAVKNKM